MQASSVIVGTFGRLYYLSVLVVSSIVRVKAVGFSCWVLVAAVKRSPASALTTSWSDFGFILDLSEETLYRL